MLFFNTKGICVNFHLFFAGSPDELLTYQQLFEVDMRPVERNGRFGRVPDQKERDRNTLLRDGERPEGLEEVEGADLIFKDDLEALPGADDPLWRVTHEARIDVQHVAVFLPNERVESVSRIHDQKFPKERMRRHGC